MWGALTPLESASATYASRSEGTPPTSNTSGNSNQSYTLPTFARNPCQRANRSAIFTSQPAVFGV